MTSWVRREQRIDLNIRTFSDPAELSPLGSGYKGIGSGNKEPSGQKGIQTLQRNLTFQWVQESRNSKGLCFFLRGKCDYVVLGLNW